LTLLGGVAGLLRALRVATLPRSLAGFSVAAQPGGALRLAARGRGLLAAAFVGSVSTLSLPCREGADPRTEVVVGIKASAGKHAVAVAIASLASPHGPVAVLYVPAGTHGGKGGGVVGAVVHDTGRIGLPEAIGAPAPAVALSAAAVAAAHRHASLVGRVAAVRGEAGASPLIGGASVPAVVVVVLPARREAL